jgi:hypothetical protein
LEKSTNNNLLIYYKEQLKDKENMIQYLQKELSQAQKTLYKLKQLNPSFDFGSFNNQNNNSIELGDFNKFESLEKGNYETTNQILSHRTLFSVGNKEDLLTPKKSPEKEIFSERQASLSTSTAKLKTNNSKSQNIQNNQNLLFKSFTQNKGKNQLARGNTNLTTFFRQSNKSNTSSHFINNKPTNLSTAQGLTLSSKPSSQHLKQNSTSKDMRPIEEILKSTVNIIEKSNTLSIANTKKIKEENKKIFTNNLEIYENLRKIKMRANKLLNNYQEHVNSLQTKLSNRALKSVEGSKMNSGQHSRQETLII